MNVSPPPRKPAGASKDKSEDDRAWLRYEAELAANPIIVQFRDKLRRALGAPIPTYAACLTHLTRRPEEPEEEHAHRAYAAYLQERRGRYIFALQALVYLSEHLGEHGLVDELTELPLALTDLDSGIVRDFLRQSAGGGQSTHVWLVRAQVCLSIEALALAGKKRRDSRAQVAGAFKHMKEIMEPKSQAGAQSYADTIEGWGKRFRGKKVGNEIAQHAFTQGLAILEECARVWPRDRMIARAHVFLDKAEAGAALIAAAPEPLYRFNDKDDLDG